jgi:ABC-type Fe3+/spermidine/putrescine transport system ATPase subunit
LNGLNLNVKRGEFLTILGPSGCGKTTTLNLLAGFEILDEGEIWIGNKDVSRIPSHERNIAMVFQNYALFPHMNVYDNIAFGLKMRKIDKNIIFNKVKNASNLVGLDFDKYKNRYRHQLSGGEQQRISLARALVIEPEVLLLDEPLSNLDAKLRTRMRLEIKRIHESVNITTIYVTHDQEEALSMSDRIVLLKEGKVIQDGSPYEIYTDPKSEFTADFIGHSNFIRGKINEIVDDSAFIQTNGGLTLKTKFREFMKKGNNITLVIRAENIRLNRNKIIGENIFEGQVRDSLYLGSIERVFIEVGDLELSVDYNHKEFGMSSRKEKIFVQISPDDIVALPGERNG